MAQISIHPAVDNGVKQGSPNFGAVMVVSSGEMEHCPKAGTVPPLETSQAAGIHRSGSSRARTTKYDTE